MRPRTAAGLCMILSSLGFFTAGGFIVSKALQEQTRVIAEKSATDVQCKQLLQTLPSVNVVDVGDVLTVVMSNVVDPRKALTDASVATMMCPARKLTEVCLGDKCPGSQDQVVLRFKLSGE